MRETMNASPEAARFAVADEDAIRTLVDRFYAKVRRDPRLGPVFDRAIGDEWDAHLAIMYRFWSSVMLRTGSYKGNPLAVHRSVDGIAPELFERWLELFDATAREVCRDELAQAFMMRARNIAESLKLGLFYRPGGDVLRAVPAPAE